LHQDKNILLDEVEFLTEAGALDFDRLILLGLMPSKPYGSFDKITLHQLITLCEVHPKYHIISVTMEMDLVNRYTNDGVEFFLGDGNANPKLTYLGPTTRETMLVHKSNASPENPVRDRIIC
jgi:hypothetical protein